MTPGARLAAAITVLDQVLAGQGAEPALIRWARGSRFAGSGDRAAVRDLVFGALRQRRSLAWIGGADTGRGLMIGHLRATGQDPERLFDGQGHAPPRLTPTEVGQPLASASPAVCADLPDWLWDRFVTDLGPDAGPVAEVLRHRAPVWLRANLARTTVAQAAAALAAEGIIAQPHADIKTALQVTAGERKISGSPAYSGGLVDLQDAASQAAVLALPLLAGMRVLDYCAGGGGKALAMAALADLAVTAHDADPARMADLPARAARAGAAIDLRATASLPNLPPFDLVLVDAPCCGSGTWRRAPEAKWRLTPARLDDLCALQRRILRQAARLVAPGGWLGYATCSVLSCENDDQVASFCADQKEFQMVATHRWRPGPSGDGFFLTVFRQTNT